MGGTRPGFVTVRAYQNLDVSGPEKSKTPLTSHVARISTKSIGNTPPSQNREVAEEAPRSLYEKGGFVCTEVCERLAGRTSRYQLWDCALWQFWQASGLLSHPRRGGKYLAGHLCRDTSVSVCKVAYRALSGVFDSSRRTEHAKRQAVPGLRFEGTDNQETDVTNCPIGLRVGDNRVE